MHAMMDACAYKNHNRQIKSTQIKSNQINSNQATTAYKALITSVDQLDSMANMGMKAKDGLKDDKEILEVYGNCVDRGADLMTLLPNIL